MNEDETIAGVRIPSEPNLDKLRAAAADCTGCHLYRNATQTVFGEGPERARVMLVGEQPGDAEDLAGHPFVGPAGKLLDRCLIEAGIEVVGRTRFCIHPREKIKNIPAVGGTKNVDWQKVNELKADLLILDQEENPKWMARIKSPRS